MIKYTMEGVNTRLRESEDEFRDLKDRIEEQAQSEEHLEKKN